MESSEFSCCAQGCVQGFTGVVRCGSLHGCTTLGLAYGVVMLQGQKGVWSGTLGGTLPRAAAWQRSPIAGCAAL